jgi:hypothetical protein
MYGSTQNHPELYEEYVSLNQMHDLDIEEKNKCEPYYYKIAGFILVFASFNGVLFYILFYLL